ncbi:MAG: paraquat-inducible protein A [Desulfobacterales bacterium]|nr:paraquat-inducible protein A [Desulfobacterales bacterium]
MSPVVCHDCARILFTPEMKPGTTAHCDRCNAKLLRHEADTLGKTLALALTCFILFIIANAWPFLIMRIEGIEQKTNMVTGILELFGQGMPVLAILVLLTALVFPLVQISGMIYLILPMKLGVIPWKAAAVYRTMRRLKPWGMMEVYMVGILISMVKLLKMATIVPGPAALAFMALICLLTAATAGLNPGHIWRRLPPKPGCLPDRLPKDTQLLACHTCGMACLCPPGTHGACSRCGASLHPRKRNSLKRTWALVIAAGVLYFPANILPITRLTAFGQDQYDTIMSGVIYFMFSGSWHIALIIFVASVVVPLMKIITLVYLLVSVRRRSSFRPGDRTRLYRITEAVGRWSMVDVYVVTILVAMVKMGHLAYMEAGPGAVFFAGVVVITMFAAESFDPRLIWDAMEESYE